MAPAGAEGLSGASAAARLVAFVTLCLAISLMGASAGPSSGADETPARAVAYEAGARTPKTEARQRGDRAKQSDRFSDIPLVTQHGERVHFYSDLVKGKAVMVNLMYTTCPEICPANSAALAQVHDYLAPWMGRDVTMLSISIDPRTDTPHKLKAYWEVFGARPGWVFLTGDYDDIERLRRELGIYDLDPVIDADKTQHSGILTFGNDRTDRWLALPILMHPKQLARTVLKSLWDGEWHRPGRAARSAGTAGRDGFRGTGVVRGLDREKGEITIEHADIPGLMPAMTMTFKIGDRSLLRGLAPDQKVGFRLHDRWDEFLKDRKYTITQITTRGSREDDPVPTTVPNR